MTVSDLPYSRTGPRYLKVRRVVHFNQLLDVRWLHPVRGGLDLQHEIAQLCVVVKSLRKGIGQEDDFGFAVICLVGHVQLDPNLVDRFERCTPSVHLPWGTQTPAYRRGFAVNQPLVQNVGDGG